MNKFLKVGGVIIIIGGVIAGIVISVPFYQAGIGGLGFLYMISIWFGAIMSGLMAYGIGTLLDGKDNLESKTVQLQSDIGSLRKEIDSLKKEIRTVQSAEENKTANAFLFDDLPAL